jgi:hypothetical protein
MRRLLILLPLLLVFASLSARAEDRLDVTWREARVIRLAKPATSIIIGDPTVADVSLDDPNTMVVFGKAPGETNIIVISGTQEKEQLDYPLVVSPSNTRHVSVLDATAATAPSEVLYSCGVDRCTRTLSPTDISFSASSRSNNTANTTNTTSATSNGAPTIPGAVVVVPNSGAPATEPENPPSSN